MKGLVGRYSQSMSARKAQPVSSVLKDIDASSSTGSVTAPYACIAHIWAWGGGGSGSSSGATSQAGGGAAAIYKRVRLSKGAMISYSVGAGGSGVVTTSPGNAGGNSTVTLPSGRILVATGGQAGADGVTTAKSYATDGDLNRYGGGSATAGEFGGAAGASGGGAGGFTDTDVGYTGGAGGAGTGGAGSAPGGGGGAHNGGGTSGAGGAGRVRILLVRAVA